ncbi:unnamed protein product [Mytilus edulis]|uniref:Uncharacterized protein n=1 Tax=Mytilus edulis TaxID=6550 RepID=A0A8S3Q3S4_MYTED|nr:unnamed protein product [Mytilus edulis]
MAVFVWLTSLVTVMVLQSANNPEDKISMEPVFTFDPADLEFIDYENMTFGCPYTCQEIIMSVLIGALFLAAVYQHKLLKREIKEMNTVFGQCIKGDGEMSAVSNFYSETECLIKDMKRKSKAMEKRFKKIEQRIPIKEDLELIKDDVDYLKDSWSNQYTTFSLLDINLNIKANSEDLKVQLAEIQGRFDAAINEVEGYMVEDEGILKSIVGDVQMLESYFEMKGIFSAAKKGDLTFIQSQNIDETTTDDDGANCLHYVCRGGNVTLVEYLVNTKQFNVSKKTKFGSTAFHEASASGSLDIVKWLWTNTQVNIDEGDDVGATPLHIAALYGQLLVVHWIINNTSCDLLLKTKKGATCLHFAVVGGNLKVVKLILTEIPRSINLQLDNGATPAYLACQYGHLEILKYLVEKNANMKMKSFDGMSYVHAASQGGHLAVVKWLVKEQGCNANDRDLDGASCLHFAATNGRASVVAWMMKEGGAKVTLDNLGGSPLHNAAELGHFEVIKALLDNGCDVNITDNDGLTAAELAEKCHQSGCAALIRGEIK